MMLRISAWSTFWINFGAVAWGQRLITDCIMWYWINIPSGIFTGPARFVAVKRSSKSHGEVCQMLSLLGWTKSKTLFARSSFEFWFVVVTVSLYCKQIYLGTFISYKQELKILTLVCQFESFPPVWSND